MSLSNFPWINDRTRLYYCRAGAVMWFYISHVVGGFEFGKDTVVDPDSEKFEFLNSTCTLHFDLPEGLWLLAMMPGDTIAICHSLCIDPSVYKPENVILEASVDEILTRYVDDFVISSSSDIKAVDGTIHFGCRVRIHDPYC